MTAARSAEHVWLGFAPAIGAVMRTGHYTHVCAYKRINVNTDPQFLPCWREAESRRYFRGKVEAIIIYPDNGTTISSPRYRSVWSTEGVVTSPRIDINKRTNILWQTQLVQRIKATWVRTGTGTGTRTGIEDPRTSL